MTDLTRELALADRRLALTAPQHHPAPQFHQREARQKATAARRADTKSKRPNLAKQLQMIKKARLPQPEPPPPPACPEQRRREQDVREEVQKDLVTALVRGTRAVAGRFCTDEKALRIENSPAVQELLTRTTGWVHSAPDLLKLPLVVGAKLL